MHSELISSSITKCHKSLSVTSDESCRWCCHMLPLAGWSVHVMLGRGGGQNEFNHSVPIWWKLPSLNLIIWNQYHKSKVKICADCFPLSVLLGENKIFWFYIKHLFFKSPFKTWNYQGNKKYCRKWVCIVGL